MIKSETIIFKRISNRMVKESYKSGKYNNISNVNPNIEKIKKGGKNKW